MMDPSIASQIIEALAAYLKRDPSSITESHHLRDDLGLDSVAVIELLFEIEDRFKIQIPDQDLAGLSTVGTVVAYVQQRLSAEPTKPSPTKKVKKPVLAGKAKKPGTAKKTAIISKKKKR